MSEKNSRQVRKEMNQLYGNMPKYARGYANLQIRKMGRIKAAFRILFKGRLF